MRLTHIALYLGLAALAGGCVPRPFNQGASGRDFAAAAFDNFVNAKTTDQQVRAALGTPQDTSVTTTLDAGGKPVTTTLWTYRYLGQGGNKFGMIRFVDSIMYSDIVVSSLPEDYRAPIPADKLTNLRHGVTTRAQVIAGLGMPSGQFMPAPRGQGGKYSVIYIASYRDGTQLRTQVVLIAFSAQSVMDNYQMSDQIGDAAANPIWHQMQTAPAAPSAAPPMLPKHQPGDVTI